jgi:ribose transport system substrate-binding protein
MLLLAGGALPMARAASPAASTSTQVLSAARVAVAHARTPVTTYGFPRVSSSVAKNKLVVAITCINDGGCLDGAQGLADAGKALGWKVQIINGEGDPGAWNAAVQKAITLHADAIELVAVPPFEVQGALQQARAAKIPVISVFNPPSTSDGIYGHVTPDQTAQGRLMADWIIADSKGTAHVIVIQDKSHFDLKMRVDALTKELARCAGCTIDGYVDTTAASVYTRLAGATVSSLQQHPDATYVIGATDGYTPFAAQAVRQVGRSGKVKVAGFDGSVQSMGLIRTGEQAMSLSEPTHFAGWLAAHLLVGAFAGQPAHDAPVLPTRLLDKANVPASGEWDADFNYKAQLTRLWGIK